MSLPANFSESTSLVLKLHTDLANIRNYEGDPELQGTLILRAEEKIWAISETLLELRDSIGMNRNNRVIRIA